MFLNICEQSSFLSVVSTVKIIIELISIIVPLILIVSLGFEIFQIVTGNDLNIKSHTNKIITKTIAAVIIFFLPIITNVILSLASGTSIFESECWNNANTDTIKLYKLQEEAKAKLDKEKRNEENKLSQKEREEIAEIRAKANEENLRKKQEAQKERGSRKSKDSISAESGLKQGTSNSGLKYWEFVPDNPTTNMALIIFLHGSGERGNLEAMVTVSFPKFMKEGVYKDYDAIFLAPNTPNDWFADAEKVKSLIDEKVEEYEIDKSHIIITGHSMGGHGTWNMLAKYKTFFSAAVPVSGCPYTSASNYLGVPIRSYVGAQESYYISCNTSVVNELKTLGSNIDFIKVPSPNDTHSTVVNIYKDPELINWMLEQ